MGLDSVSGRLSQRRLQFLIYIVRMIRKAYRINPGNIAHLKPSEEELPEPGQGEVQIAVKCIGLNFADLYTVWGMYKAAPTENFIPGLEYSGIISAIGEGVDGWKIGDRIMGITRFGAYTTAINIEAHYITRVPDDWSFEEGASFVVQALTAYYGMVDLGRLERGETVLIHSAAGGVGLQANRIAKRMGAFTIGSVGSDRKVDKLKEEGYDRWIVRSDNFANDLRDALGDRELNVVMECIGGKILKEGFRALTAQGRMIVYGNASFTTAGDAPNKLKMLWRYLRRPKIDPLILPNTNKMICGFNLIWLYPQIERFHGILQALSDLQLPAPLVGETYPFDALADAVRKLQSGQTMGKVVVQV